MTLFYVVRAIPVLRHAGHKEKYRAEKEKIAIDIINIVDDRIGEIKKFVDMVDIATLATYVNYTGNWKGSTKRETRQLHYGNILKTGV